MKRTALITGSASGLGRVAAERLAQDGYSIITTYRHSRERAESFMAELEEKYQITAAALPYDAAKRESHANLLKQCAQIGTGIDILVHNAGPYIQERKTMAEYTVEEWEYMIQGNLTSMFLLAHGILPRMRENGWGRIITMGFDQSNTAPGWKYRSAFAAAKSGLTSLTKTLSIEEAEYGITVNMVCPGDIVPPYKEMNHPDRKEKTEVVPVGRPGTGGDIARVISFLCNEDSDFITGAVIPVTGGQDVLSKYR
ncbi:3-ketoacyl-ACP reductase [Bacillus sp. FJAT-27916]|uniref:SDR family oxidoreductase n=1 Tax=Bacillus sp. FJAT-27916 TaxID=1679169 RepID=UPI0006716159|nr:SDR family oxidoreductase [Bacillus sp. FJAT-27916]KMY44275.1 3-ketoacyl-ACP reductase [Bacillus sp. FJAT-27916]